MIWLSSIALLLAAIPAVVFLRNLGAYRPPVFGEKRRAVSVLIPARNEARSIRAAVESVLANEDAELEIIVMNDHSTDATRAIVRELSARDSRVRLADAPALPARWNGKQHACQRLSELAKNPVLLFLDADVRLAPDAVARAASFLESSGAALASGFPRQEFSCALDRLLLPLIHFVLLGFLPIARMRRTLDPAFAAGCGQLFVVDAAAYHRAGGHAAIRHSAHDGLALPRAFRKSALRTDLFDATDLAVCRMYSTNAETWRGLAKNATEGLAAPGRIVPVTLLLLGGHVLPFVLLARSPGILSGLAAALSLLPRIVAARKFRQPFLSALLHPLGVIALIVLQWFALVRSLAGKPAVWKGRAHFAPSTN